jgi:hypothetical protein
MSFCVDVDCCTKSMRIQLLLLLLDLSSALSWGYL